MILLLATVTKRRTANFSANRFFFVLFRWRSGGARCFSFATGNIFFFKRDHKRNNKDFTSLQIENGEHFLDIDTYLQSFFLKLLTLSKCVKCTRLERHFINSSITIMKFRSYYVQIFPRS